MEIIDSHCHVYPKISYLLRENSPKIPTPLIPLIEKVEELEKKLTPGSMALYEAITPLLSKFHQLLSKFNHEVEYSALNTLTDKLYTLGSVGTLFCRDYHDLKKQMDDFGITASVVIAHPPFISNDYILELATLDPSLIPIINIPEPVDHLEDLIVRYHQRGAKGIKIHAAASGINPVHTHHKELVGLAKKYKLPVIIHTGALEIYPVYKKPDYGHAEEFSELIEMTDTPIILAHMNIHYPETAIEMCEIYPHVYTDTSWQGQNTILRGVNKCGSHKILFGTDWPIVGNNYNVGLSRIMELNRKQEISSAQLKDILADNAKKIFQIKST